jgi:hypothetical protein
LAAGLRQLGVRILNDSFFDTLTVDSSVDHDAILERARGESFNFRLLPVGVCGEVGRICT